MRMSIMEVTTQRRNQWRTVCSPFRRQFISDEAPTTDCTSQIGREATHEYHNGHDLEFIHVFVVLGLGCAGGRTGAEGS